MIPADVRHQPLDLLAAGVGESVAIVDARSGTTLTYDALRNRVAERRRELDLAARSLVVIAASNSLEFVVDYLAVLADDHVPILAGDHADRLADAWGAAAVIRPGSGDTIVERRAGRPHELHRDLALMLSTSGSTGSPKLVRLSRDNVWSNALAIAHYLDLDAGDRAITSLPLHYCYGLSVLHSHVAVGASIVLTDASIVDPCFADALRRHRVTNVAGVPHTFELLERAGPELLRTDSLRLVTQAGGRMSPDRVSAWLDRGEAWGFDLYVMYGQTEATARMAYLPPALARRYPGAIGVPIPGGHLEVRALDECADGVGELVYRGPNVMLGYATHADDLALGATIDELSTGDIGRVHADGVFEVVGRRSRFVKPFGLRIDLDAVESVLAGAGVRSAVTGDDQRLVVCVPDSPAERVRDHVVDLTGLPRGAVAVDVGNIPRTPSDKVDYARILDRNDGANEAVTELPVDVRVADLYRNVLGSDQVSPHSTFVSLGGDSLSYVECSLQLERTLGRLPSDWHVMAVADLEAITPRRSRPRVDTTVLFRALGICAIVSTHMHLVWFPGGSHLLLAVAGYNLARFQLPIESLRDRVRSGMRTAARVATPAVIWTAICMLLVGGYSWATLLLVNNNIGPTTHDQGRWHYWFTEVFVQITVVATLLLSIPVVRRWERRAPYLVPLAIFLGLLVFRYRWIELGPYPNLRFRTQGVAWFFALGWLAQQSTTTTKRILTSVLCWYTVDGFFLGTDREMFITVAIIGLVWIKAVPIPRPAISVVAAIAAASMWIYITHFRIFPPLERNLPLVAAYALTIASGVAIWRAVDVAGRLARRAADLVLDRGEFGRAEVARSQQVLVGM